MAKLKTIYKIRAEIPAQVAREFGLLAKAREIGLNLKLDDTGNVEGAWDASLLNLATVLNTLQNAGVERPLIQRRIITFSVAVESSKAGAVMRILGQAGLSQSQDVFSDESVLRCNVPCEEAEAVLSRLREAGVGKVIATESFEVVTMPNG